MTANYSVPDISCQHCVDAITTEVTKVEGVTDVTVDLDTKTVAVIGGDETAIVAAIDKAGYDVTQ
ncbi:MAG: heavy-metal-associated domain-containing protein [Acidimicrobiia bacterium]|nr:heavy-metal-associated domain-containing protein [Acidimicrobiia bacterium]